MRMSRVSCALLGCLVGVTAAHAQFPQLITDFETAPDGGAYLTQPASLGDLEVVIFQDPAEADVTTANIVGDIPVDPNVTPLPSTEESFIADFTGDSFFGANNSNQFLDIRFQWADPNDDTRWALIETLQSPTLGDPSVHLDGTISFYVNIPDCSAFEFTDLTRTPQIGVALLIAETGNDLPQGFQDFDILNGDLEFVGVSSVTDPNSATPRPVPTTVLSITDNDCSGSSTGPAGDWRLVTFDLDTASVVGWTAEGGDGVLDATGVGDGVNRGVLAGLVLTVQGGDTTSEYLEFLVDQITFEAPVTEPAVAPSIASPVVANDVDVQVNDLTPRATNVTVEVDRADGDNDDPFVADETFSASPGLSTTGEARFAVVGVTPALAVGDRVRAFQTVGGDVGPFSSVVPVNPPAAFSATLALDEDGNFGAAPADFIFVGALSTTPVGKPVLPIQGVWQKLEYSLIPGVEPLQDFAGGGTTLDPDGGLYNIDSMFFTIDQTEPSAGPYTLYIDRVYYIDPNGDEQIISSAELGNPFPFVRGQSTAINTSSTLSTAASFDGVSSNLHTWEFPDTAGSNTYAPFRPAVAFSDASTAVGMYLLVVEADPNAPAAPSMPLQIVGSAPAVTVTGIDPAATSVDLLVNGFVQGTVNPAGATSVDIVPNIPLLVFDSVSATYDVGGETSNLALARGVTAPNAPTVAGPLVVNQTSVTVSGILNAANATANEVKLFIDGVEVASVDPAGAASVVFNVNPALAEGEQVTASQVVNGVESDQSSAVGVGTGVVRNVVINEFVYDDLGGDDREFIELYNAGSSSENISGWTLRLSSTPDVVIPAATTLAPGDFYVVGNASVANVDQTWGTDALGNGVDSIELLDQNSVLVDVVIYELNKGPVAASPGEGGIWGNFTSIDGTFQSWARWFDGFDTDDNGRDFGLLPLTPGATNEGPVITPLSENFDAVTVGDGVPNFLGSFVNLAAIDPTVADALNPNVIPASPQGGNAAVMWDPSGGGNQAQLLDLATFSLGFTAEIYIDVDMSPFVPADAVETENWSIGLGSIGPFHNNLGTVFNGNTGLMWQFEKVEDPNNDGTVGSVSLQLVNRGSGGNDAGVDGVDFEVLFDVPAVDLTTGWHTISLERNFETVTASFNGLNVATTVTGNGPSTLMFGYREFTAGPLANLRPPTIDNLVVTVPAAPTTGACCTDGGGCSILTEAACIAFGGSYGGDNTDCSDGDISGQADACEALSAPAPMVAGPICSIDKLVEVTGVVATASEVTVFENGVNPIGSAVPGGASTVRVVLTSDLTPGADISATQSVGSAESVQSAAVMVEDCSFACDMLFMDDLDTDTSANYTVVVGSADTAVTFAYDYSADGVPASPGGSGSTIGLKMEANLTDGAADVVSVAPTGITPAGDYTLTAEIWINFAIAGSGTTEFIGAGVGFDGLTADQNGATFIGAGEGGSGFADFRGFADGVTLTAQDGNIITDFTNYDNADDPSLAAAFPAEPVPAGQGQAGSGFDGGLAFKWRLMEMRVDRSLETVTVTIDGVELGTITCGGELGNTCSIDGLVRMMYVEVFASVASQPQFQFGLFDNITVVENCDLAPPCLCGDVNNDGAVNAGDIDCFVQAVVSGTPCDADCSLIAADTNGDMVVNAGDIDSFVDAVVSGSCQ